MMQDDIFLRTGAKKPNGITLIRNMADAVSYLCSVASEAGLDGIASRLAGIRVSLLRMAAGQEDASFQTGKKQAGN